MYERGKKIFDKQFPGENITYAEKLTKLANLGLTGHQIIKEMNIGYTTLHRWLRKLNINLPNYHNALKFDNTVFDTIDTEEKAYWLGFMYADGYVQNNGNSVELSLKGSDVEHLEKFRVFLQNSNEVKIGTSKCGDKRFTRCRLIMTDKHFHDTLIEKGCVPNKSLILTFPDKSLFSSEDLIIHFIRGYIDGDGCITYGCTGYSIISIIGTKEFLDGLMELYPDIFTTIYHKDKRHPTSNTYCVELGAEKSAEFGQLLYSNATVFLQRKYDKFINNKYDKREHIRRMYTHSEKQLRYFNRGSNRHWQDINSSSDN